MTKVTINGKTYEITYGPFGEHIIDGKTWDEFWDSLPREEIAYMASKGMELAIREPATFKDIAERLELEDEITDILHRKGKDA